MDFQQAYSRIDELYLEYINSEDLYKNAIKTKLIKIICDIVNYKYKHFILNGDFDYLPVLTATTYVIKSFPKSKNKKFSSYLFRSIDNAINNDIEKNKRIGFELNYSATKKLRKIKKYLELYNGDKKKVSDILGLSIEKLDNYLTLNDTAYLDKKVNPEDSDFELADTLQSNLLSIEDKIDSTDDIDKVLKEFDVTWASMKSIHKDIISDWLTNQTLSAVENSKFVTFIETPELALKFFYRYSFINKNIVQAFFNDKTFELSLTYDSIAEKHGITKSAVYKKISIFVETYKKNKKS